MFSPLANFINDIALGPEKRKVKQYLDAATRKSVCRDLGEVLAPQLRTFKERELLRATFDKYAIEVPSGRKFWTEESFRNHIRSTHADAAISDAAIRLLWRSFNFYARHPFPTLLLQPQNVTIDFDAFRRAALLTVFQCDGLLGTRELDWYWREDAAFFRRAGFARMFSSIAHASTSWEPQQQVDAGLASTTSDAIDVLVMLGPQFIHAVPSQDQLELVARKLFAEQGPGITRKQILRQNDLSTLVDLLLRLQLREQRWGLYYHFGDIVEADSEDRGVTNALVEFLIGNVSGDNITVQQLSGRVDLLPNFLLRFQQLWAVLFQPAEATKMITLPMDKVGLTSISAAISLFAPHIEFGNAGHQQTDKQDTRVTIEAATQALSTSQDITMVRLTQALSGSLPAYVVLFTTGANTTPKTIMGGYFPVPSEKSSHILFQLQPTLHLLHWAKAKMSLVDLIKVVGEPHSGGTVASEGSNSPYWIGDPLELGVGLRIDPEKRAVTLTNSGRLFYVDEAESSGNENSGKSWDVTIQDARMSIFIVAGARDDKKN
ncbi:hypothetical protein F5Y19DRAFT_432162 [Xylariaceae sp. FL1651]|nr:hypothetical protein F5Y19DRAFT_432162 [Xylariaceae sp. FL1651]